MVGVEVVGRIRSGGWVVVLSVGVAGLCMCWILVMEEEREEE